MTFITRAQWGARAPKSTGNAISAHPLGVAVHYSAANLGTYPDSTCDDKVRGIQDYHMDHNDWADGAYSYVVCPHGNIYEMRGTGKGSAANGTTKANLERYAVCALGGPKDTPSVLMLDGIGTAIGMCRKAGAGSSVVGHRDLISTACPGNALYAYVTSGRWTKLVVKVKAAVVRVVTSSHRDTRPPITDPFQEDSMDRLIIALYRKLLGRTPAESEVDGWLVSAAQGNWAGRDLPAQFLASRAEAATVVKAYADFLGRAPSPTEAKAWSDGETVAQVRNGVANSPEAKAHATKK